MSFSMTGISQNTKRGVKDSLPIAFGYLAVSITLGIQARTIDMNLLQSILMSLSTNASAGEYAGLLVIRENSGPLMMILMTLVASGRYFLMSCALSQHIADDYVPLWQRLYIGFFLTDEAFALAIRKKRPFEFSYNAHIVALPWIFWSLGTALGWLLGDILPAPIVLALSVALYGMFIAIIVPPMKKDKVIFGAVILSFAASFALSRLFPKLSEGVRIFILTVVISSLAAIFFPKEVPADE